MEAIWMNFLISRARLESSAHRQISVATQYTTTLKWRMKRSKLAVGLLGNFFVPNT